MDAAPPPYSDMPAPPSGSPIVAERRSELLLDGLKTAIAASGEHRLFRFGRLAGLFPSRAGLSAEAAGMAATAWAWSPAAAHDDDIGAAAPFTLAASPAALKPHPASD